MVPWISTEWWQILLDGTFGALVAAGVSVWVALLVVKRSNKAQRKIAKKQLRSQEKLLREEMAEVRTNTRQDALVDAVVSYLAAMNQFVTLPGPDFARSQEIALELDRQMFRLLLLGDESARLGRLLQIWPQHFVALRYRALASTSSDDEKAESEDRILDAITQLERLVPQWVEGSNEQRQAIEEEIRDERKGVATVLGQEVVDFLEGRGRL
ncbi:hypothetical protein [Arthrobacter sp. CP30]